MPDPFGATGHAWLCRPAARRAQTERSTALRAAGAGARFNAAAGAGPNAWTDTEMYRLAVACRQNQKPPGRGPAGGPQSVPGHVPHTQKCGSDLVVTFTIGRGAQTAAPDRQKRQNLHPEKAAATKKPWAGRANRCLKLDGRLAAGKRIFVRQGHGQLRQKHQDANGIAWRGHRQVTRLKAGCSSGGCGSGRK